MTPEAENESILKQIDNENSIKTQFGQQTGYSAA
jgi:hypothetical protein